MGEYDEETSERKKDVDKENGVVNSSEGDNNKSAAQSKKTSDALLDELFSCIQQSGACVDVAEAITEETRSRRERAIADRDRSRSPSHSKKHKHKKSKKEKKHKKHRSRSRSNDRRDKKRHRSNSSSPERTVKTGTLADIKILTKTKNLNDLHNTVPVTSTSLEDEDDDLPVGADYRTVMHEAVASSSTQPTTSQGTLPPDLPTERKMKPAFPLSKSDGEKKDPIEGKSNPMLKKVINEKGGALMIPRKIQIDVSKTNGSVQSSDPSLEGKDRLQSPPLKSPPKITFGNITLKVGVSNEEKKTEKVDEEKKEEEVVDKVEDNSKTEQSKTSKETTEEKEREKKAPKKMAVRRRRSTSVDDTKVKKEKKDDRRDKDRKRSRSRDRRDRSRDRDRNDRNRRDRSRSRDRKDRDRKDDRRISNRRRSRSRSADRKKDNDRDKRRRSRSPVNRRRSRSRSRSGEKIDKAKLLAIALQNSKGQGGGPVAEKQGVNMKILEKAGGRNIGDIVSYCQKLSATEGIDDRRDSDDEDALDALKNKKSIKLNIPDSKQLPTRTPQERLLIDAPLRAAFPVSSGAIHRDSAKETSFSEWKRIEASVPSVCTDQQKKLVATTSLTKIKASKEGKPIPTASFPILPPPPVPPSIRGDLLPPPPVPPSFVPASLVPPPPMPPTIITPSNDRLINMHDEDPRGVKRKMDERARCVQKLIKDPNDSETLRTLRSIDDDLNNMGRTAELSGKWSGHTRVNLLSAQDLQPSDPRYHAWIKKDLFKNTAPVVGGVGMILMQKMGWQLGEGLGRERQGDTLPLVLDVKSDRKGLACEYDNPVGKSKSKGTKGKGPKPVGSVSEAKNPISQLMELCQKKKWGNAEFVFNENALPSKAPSQFICTVKLNGIEIIGPLCATKKLSKTKAAELALEKIGYAAPNVAVPQIYDPSSAYSIPEQIVQASVRSVFEKASLTAIPPPQAYFAPPEPLPAKPMIPDYLKKNTNESIDPLIPPPPPPQEPTPVAPTSDAPSSTTSTSTTSTRGGTSSSRGGRGRGGMRGRGGGGVPHSHHPQYPPYYPSGPIHSYDLPYGMTNQSMMDWRNEPLWQEDFAADIGAPPAPPSYSSFPSSQYSARSNAHWQPDDEFHSGGGSGPFPGPPQSGYGRPPQRREHSPAYEQPRYS